MSERLFAAGVFLVLAIAGCSEPANDETSARPESVPSDHPSPVSSDEFNGATQDGTDDIGVQSDIEPTEDTSATERPLPDADQMDPATSTPRTTAPSDDTAAPPGRDFQKATWRDDWRAFATEASKIIVEKDPVAYLALNSTFGDQTVEWTGTISNIESPTADDKGVVELSMVRVDLNISKTETKQLDSLRLNPAPEEWAKWKTLSPDTKVRFRTTLAAPNFPGAGIVMIFRGAGPNAGKTMLAINTKGAELVEVFQP